MGGKLVSYAFVAIIASVLIYSTHGHSPETSEYVAGTGEYSFLRLIFFVALTMLFVAALILINEGSKTRRIPKQDFVPLAKQMSASEYETRGANKTRSEMSRFRQTN
jgi:hypothetical protein